MSRKDYIRTALILKRAMLTTVEKEPLAQQFADMFAEDNPAFDRDKFLIACGVKG